MSNTLTRRFEFVGGGSDKFWEVTQNGAQVIVCYGRNGAAGQIDTKSFSNSAAAQKHAEKKIAEKLAKGYSEIQAA